MDYIRGRKWKINEEDAEFSCSVEQSLCGEDAMIAQPGNDYSSPTSTLGKGEFHDKSTVSQKMLEKK